MGPRVVCACYLDGEVEQHDLVSGRCAICGYDANNAMNKPEGEKVQKLEPEAKAETEKGCKSVLGAASAVLGTVMTLGCALALKKKEDN